MYIYIGLSLSMCKKIIIKLIGSLTDMEGEKSEGNREQRSREGGGGEKEEGGRLVSSIYNIILENVGRREPK